KIVLTGTTGGLGSRVLHHLLPLVPPSSLTLSLSRPPASPTHPSGCPLVHGDFSQPSTLDRAFSGAARLLLVSSPGIAHHTAAIDAAKRAGVAHVFYTSLAFAGGRDKTESATAVMQAHLDTEAYLKASGLTYTVVREGLYCESWPLYLGFWQPSNASDEIVVPGDGGIAWIARDDLGAATAKLIAEGSHENETVLLTGQRALTLAQLTPVLASLLSRPRLRLSVASADEYVARNVDPADARRTDGFLRAWARTYEGLERGEAAVVDPLVVELLGREPRSMEAYLRETLLE
ncbi:NAD(P)-binding protein, partial [Punctularia strigosozonata HHB-11173 SS5]|uniref:NAD(P)-binding protein n=1 Tax=Punctularia strigosozonata (strain HHB-11173) TaxID=741275 RepID=UPI000441778A